MKKVIGFLVLAAAPVAASDLNEREQAAYDRLLPALVALMAELSPDTDSEVMGGHMATCAATTAKRREVKMFGALEEDADLTQEVTEALNDIMQRPKFATCLQTALSQ